MQDPLGNKIKIPTLRPALKFIFAVFVAGGLLSGGPVAAEDRPNIIFLDICSARADHFSSYGYSRETTPNIDKVAKEGVVFDNAMAQSSWCLPNYASLFTGLTPEAHGLYTNTVKGLPPFEATLADCDKNR